MMLIFLFKDKLSENQNPTKMLIMR